MAESLKPSKQPKRVSVEEADNGYMVSSYESSTDGPGREKKMVCKTIDEAMMAVKKMMGGGKATEEDIRDEAVDFFKNKKEE